MGTQRVAAVVDDGVRDAIANSHLRSLPADTVEALLEGSRWVQVRAGSTVRGAGEVGPHMEPLVDGFVRVYVIAPDGRTLTVLYARRGAVTGVASLFTPNFSMPGSIQALLDSDLLALDPHVVRRLAECDLGVAQSLLGELSERVVSFVTEIPGNAFASVRQRVARHLLDLASEQQHGDELVAHLSQQALADAVGSVREVVVRVLRELREDGRIRTGRGDIVIVDPDQLMWELFPVAPGTGGERDWNAGP